MKNILYISPGDHLDYQDDCLFIGLREVLGESLVDLNKRFHSYVSYEREDAKKLYGKGMTVTRLLEDIPIDRSDTLKKIKSKFYDLIVYGSINRCHDYLHTAMQVYPKNRIVFVDGEDGQNYIKPYIYLGCPYFKRELATKRQGVFPISFAIPTMKFNPSFVKERDIAYCDPRDRRTYIYNDEDSYYFGYKQSSFAITTRKAGWDCLRHYEILANGALPLFLDIENCPESTMTTFNKDICKKILKDMNRETASTIYEKYAEAFIDYAKKNNTTLALGNTFLAQCRANL
jgi:hypothetical protein